MHVHIKATKSIILILSLSTGSRTLLPRPHTTTHAIPQAAVTRSTRHIHRHNHRIRITRYISSTPSSSTRAQGPTWRRTVTIAVIVTRSGVAGVSQLIGETEGKGMEQEGERRSVADAARERADNMRRGQQAQPHSSHTTRRHPRNEGKERQQPPTMQWEKISANISHSSFLQPQGNGKSPAATTQRTRSEHPPHQPQPEANPHS
ncbi:hypothetical protein TcCL_Unassigned04227, partial [Trypanosoma cruzi]